ncbi:MAG: hypothetical protein QM256_12490 [Pseudomonadota bacterium]|jgi:hypothetical protein|nr:hypothetical protein [Pseudomonadota bacterium]HNU85346.1 hypothetical protein [Syntrophales bacterium]HNZ34450.1 hypothetical protein [Syntrophales bacterium]HOF72675.1 hypothetical protein [Syntrophales bacterium]HOH44789.1 hypothetical protein [Syntrophales bacterium]
MKEKARNVKIDGKFWTDPMSFPVYTPKRGRKERTGNVRAGR